MQEIMQGSTQGLKDKVVIVTGGAGGIGRALCERFAAAGSSVAVVDLNGGAAGVVAEALRSAGHHSAAFEADISDYAQVRDVVGKIEAQLGGVDILINNAGWDVFRPFVDTDPSLWKKLIDINLIGALNMHHVVLPYMVARQSGKVVNIASDAARVGSSGESVYAACKAGLIALSKTLAREHAKDNITFNVVCPGPTDTKLLQGILTGAGNPEKFEAAFKKATF